MKIKRQSIKAKKRERTNIKNTRFWSPFTPCLRVGPVGIFTRATYTTGGGCSLTPCPGRDDQDIIEYDLIEHNIIEISNEEVDVVDTKV